MGLAILLARINHAERVERIASPLGFSKRKLRLAGGRNSKLKPASPRGFLLGFFASRLVFVAHRARVVHRFFSLPSRGIRRLEACFFQQSSKDLEKGRRKEIDRGRGKFRCSCNRSSAEDRSKKSVKIFTRVYIDHERKARGSLC